LGGHKAFHCKLATNGERFTAGRIYIARSDYHLLVKKNHLLVTKGARKAPMWRRALEIEGETVIDDGAR